MWRRLELNQLCPANYRPLSQICCFYDHNNGYLMLRYEIKIKKKQLITMITEASHDISGISLIIVIINIRKNKSNLMLIQNICLDTDHMRHSNSVGVV